MNAPRIVGWSLIAFAALAAGLGVWYGPMGHPGAWAGVGVAAVLFALAVRALRARRWLEPMFAALYTIALGEIVGGAIGDADVHIVGGLLMLTILSVGAAVLSRLPARDPPP